MAEKSANPPKLADPKAARENRLTQALRANLRRRKQTSTDTPDKKA